MTVEERASPVHHGLAEEDQRIVSLHDRDRSVHAESVEPSPPIAADLTVGHFWGTAQHCAPFLPRSEATMRSVSSGEDDGAGRYRLFSACSESHL